MNRHDWNTIAYSLRKGCKVVCAIGVLAGVVEGGLGLKHEYQREEVVATQNNNNLNQALKTAVQEDKSDFVWADKSLTGSAVNQRHEKIVAKQISDDKKTMTIYYLEADADGKLPRVGNQLWASDLPSVDVRPAKPNVPPAFTKTMPAF